TRQQEPPVAITCPPGCPARSATRSWLATASISFCGAQPVPMAAAIAAISAGQRRRPAKDGQGLITGGTRAAHSPGFRRIPRTVGRTSVKLLREIKEFGGGVRFELTVPLRVQRFSSLTTAMLARIGPIHFVRFCADFREARSRLSPIHDD